MKKNNQDDWTYHFKGKKFRKKRFNNFDNPPSVFKNIRDGTSTLEKAKQFKLDFNKLKKGRHNWKERKTVLYNTEILYKARNCVINSKTNSSKIENCFCTSKNR